MAGPVKAEPQKAPAQKAAERSAAPEQTSEGHPLSPLSDIAALSRPMPSNGAPHQIRAVLNLQRTIGNRATGQLLRRTAAGRIQPKLTVGPAGDMYEREADAAADRVAAGKPVERLSRLPAGAPPQRAQRQPEAMEEETEEEEAVQAEFAEDEKDRQEVQRKEPEKLERVQMQEAAGEQEVHTAPVRGQEAEEDEGDEGLQAARAQRQEGEEETAQAFDAQPLAQRMCPACEEEAQSQVDEEEEPVQTKAGGGPELDTAVAESAMARSGSGNPLAPDLQGPMEESFGSDFSAVRVHTDPAAQEANQAINARAFTHSSEIYLGRGESSSDTRLMAHELTHVVQQGGGGNSIHRQLRDAGPGSAERQSPQIDAGRRDETVSYADAVEAELGRPDPVAGVGDYAAAWRLLIALPMGELVVREERLFQAGARC